jgi:hypothetical protein
MSKFLLKSLLVSPAVLGAVFAIAAPGMSAEIKTTSEVSTLAQSALEQPLFEQKNEQKIAQALPAESQNTSLEQINRYVREGRSNKVGQVTSVSQLTDVRPTDWAFQALQSLVERYGCIVGYPDKTYRGNRALTRYEFAAGLNACLDKIQDLIAAATADFVKKEDLEVIKRLQEEFAAELAALRGRVDALEVRTATLEKQQFSTTTKLSGEVIFAITDEFAQPGNNETVFQDRVRLTLSSSFSGKDKLIVRLAAGNAEPFRYFNTQGEQEGVITEGSQTFNAGNTGGNSVSADWVAYYFPLGQNIQVYVPAVNGLHYDIVPTHSGFMEDYDGGNGALSLFAQRNPIYGIGGGAGIGATIGAGKPLSISLSYLSSTANNPARGAGLFDGSYSALGQINFTPSDKFSVGLAYVNAFQKQDTGIFNGNFNGRSPLIGSVFSNFGTLAGTGTEAFTGRALTRDQGVKVNGGGLSGVFKLSDTFAVNGWVSYLKMDGLRDGLDDIDVWTYALGLSFADFGKKGNLLGLIAGAEPYRGGLEVPIHVEGFYRIRLNDNISVTPGVIWVINAGQTDDKNTLIGTLRTTFTF